MNIAFEKKIKEIVTPILKKGRDNDLEHTMQVVDIARYLLKHEEGDEEIVILTAYLHDLGWSTVDTSEFYNGKHTLMRDNNNIVFQHMRNGAIMAADILKDQDYQDDKIDRITSIISVHDDYERLVGLNDNSAILVHDADCLDRFRPDRFHRIMSGGGKVLTPKEYNQKKQHIIEHALRDWFITDTAKRLAKDWGDALIKGHSKTINDLIKIAV